MYVSFRAACYNHRTCVRGLLDYRQLSAQIVIIEEFC